MSKEVKRYCLGEFAEKHTYPIGPGAHVLAADYEALLAESERNERMLLAACIDMGAIGEALGADMNSDGEELLSIVADMKAERDALLAERDGLAAARNAYASEFPPDENGEPDVGSVHANIRTLKAERDAMAKALKEIDAADWSSSESATDNEISMAKGTLIRQMKRIASAALQGEQP